MNEKKYTLKWLPVNEELTEKEIIDIERRFRRKTHDYLWDVRGHLEDYDTSKFTVDYIVNSMVADWKSAQG